MGLLYFFSKYCQLLFFTGSVFNLLCWLNFEIGFAELFSIMLDLQWNCSVEGYIEG